MFQRPVITLPLLISWIFCCVASLSFAQNDPAFNASVEYYIHAMIPQPDGRLIVAGDLISLNGVWRDRIGRLNTDGSLDTSFNPDTNGVVYAAALLTNGQVLVGGNFPTFGGLPRASLARLNSDGSVDPAFTNGVSLEVDAMALQGDGKVLVGGYFTNLAGQPRTSLGRLNADGSLDIAFNPTVDGTVYSIAVQPNGKILVVGSFGSVNGYVVGNICRLNANGTLDLTFGAWANSAIYSVAVQPDSKILIGGPFSMASGVYRYGIARLDSIGEADTNFNANVAPGYFGEVTTIAIQCDGKILAGGSMTGWFAYPYFARFNSNGTTDTGFVVDAPSGVRSAVLQRDGKILRATQHSLARMTNTPATESLIYSNSIITWQRGGSAPEAWRTTFEYSTNRTNWTVIGPGTRIAGGWQFTSVFAPTNAFIRARAFTTGGFFNSSTYFVEAYAGAPVIVSPPVTRTNNAGTTASFTVLADGSPTLTYRWRKNATNLTDSGNISGATNATLTLTNVVKADAAPYAVIISNKFGAITSAVANLVVNDPFIATPPTDQYVNAGDNASFAVTASGSSAIRFQWLRNGSPVAAATNTSLTLTNVQGTDSGSLFRVVVTNSAGVVTSSPALLTVNVATVDAFNPQPNYAVYSIALQPDAKILLGGNFSFLNGRLQSGLARLHPDGSTDTNFLGSLNGIPFSDAGLEIAVQPDVRIALAGSLSFLNGTPRNRLGRLTGDGGLDASFNPGASPEICAMSSQPDGRILCGGSFTNLAGQSCNRIGRLNSDGSLDTNFIATAGGTIYALAQQADGKILVGGQFTTLGGQARTNLGRLNANGSLDAAFTASANAVVKAIAVLTNGIAIGGDFTTLAGQPCNFLGRLGTSGAFDATFVPAPDSQVETLATEVDGRLVVGGNFTSIGGRSRPRLARLNWDGSADMAFNPGADGVVGSVAIQPDGKIIAAGAFSTLNGQPRPFIGRLSSTASVTNSLSFTTTNITWLRSGAGPEVWKTSFEFTTNGTSWTQLCGTRIAGGWRVSGLNLTGSATIRARGFVSGSSDGSSWFVESAAGPAAILSQPASRTNVAFTLAQFSVDASGAGPLTYQWLKDGSPLTDTGNIGGTQTPWLNISNVLGADAAGYQLVVSNASGSVTSTVATLTVIDPMLTSQPVSQTNNAGTTATFNASAIGTTNLNYQWLKNGTNLTDGGNILGATTTTLTLTNVLGGDAGAYQFIAANIWGSVTSSIASLTVIDPLLTSAPSSQQPVPGLPTWFTITATGTAPLQYQWLKDGSPVTDGGYISGARSATLMFSNAYGADVGAYRVIVSNVWGSVTSPAAMLTMVDPQLVSSPVSQTLQRGQSASISAIVAGTPPLAYQWRKNGTNLPGATAASLIFTNVQWADDGTYQLFASNSLGSVTSAVATLTVNLTPADTFNPALNNQVFALARQADGKILAGGDFTVMNGQARWRLAQLNPDGSTTTDSPFGLGTSNSVRCLAVEDSGSILVGGDFIWLGGVPRGRMGRFYPSYSILNPYGSIDGTFDPAANSSVRAMAIQPDGKIIVGGFFNTLGGSNCNYLGRLNPDGSLDASLNAAINGFVYAVALQPDGRIVVGGFFTSAGGAAHTNFVRLETNGLADASFNASSDWTVWSLALQADGKVLAGGQFNSVSGQARQHIARLNEDGSLDASFNPGVTNANASPEVGVHSLTVQTDGRILVGGFFDTIGGIKRNGLGRLYADGSPDPTLNATATTDLVWIYALGIQPDGKVLIGGHFSSIAGQPRTYLARLNNSEAATNNLSFDATTITWLRGGTSSEIWRANFAYSTNGQWWTDLGDGSRTPGGWQLTGLSLPAGAIVRARGFVVGGGWFDETLAGAPFIFSMQGNQTNNATAMDSINVYALPGLPTSYQWLKDGATLTDGGNISGTATPSLILSNLFGADGGGYSVILSNSFGSVTSSVANLTVVDPFIASQPASQSTNLGQSITFNVTALGTSPLNYRWRKEGVELSGANSTNLTLANLQATNAGSYDVIVSNTFGSVTSSVATLTLNLAVPDVFNPGANGAVNTLALQADGKILVGGSFTSLGGQLRRNLGRLNADGTVDVSFVSNVTNTSANVLLVQTNGQILVAGVWSEQNRLFNASLWRVDVAGNLVAAYTNLFTSTVNALAQTADGRVYAGGSFTVGKPGVTTNLARLFANGSLDSNFVATANGIVNTLALQPDGKLVVGGAFTTFDGQGRNSLARVNSDGTLDTNFNPNVGGSVNSLAVQPDGKILLGGGFGSVAGTNRARLARLNPDGTLDTGFNAGSFSANGLVTTLALQADGKILLGGSFTSVGGQTRNRLARLNADGSVDAVFNPGANSFINAFAIQPSGTIVVGGGVIGGLLTQIGGQPRTNIARLVNTGPVTQSLNFNGSTVTWQRSGPGVEFWRTSFESSTNGVDWISLGSGTWITNGWQLGGLSFPLRSMIRARGFVTGGLNNGSGWFVESVNPSTVPPEILPAAGGYAFNIHALPGQVLVIEATENFTFWTPVQTNVVTDLGAFVFAEAQAGLFPHRFYRAKIFNGTLPVPGFGNSFNLDPSGFGFDLNGTPGQSLIVETSTNLSLWTPLATNTLETGTTNFIDFGATNSAWQFYRLKVK